MRTRGKMTVMKKSPTTLSVPLTSDVKKHLEAIAKRDHPSPEELTADVPASFVSDEEAETRIIAERARLAESGAARISHASVAEWLRSWGTDKELPRPKPAA